jgi:hypothetical protein
VTHFLVQKCIFLGLHCELLPLGKWCGFLLVPSKAATDVFMMTSRKGIHFVYKYSTLVNYGLMGGEW